MNHYAWQWCWRKFDCVCHAHTINNKIIKDHHVKGIKFCGFLECPKIDFPGLIIYLYNYRFTVSENKKETNM